MRTPSIVAPSLAVTFFLLLYGCASLRLPPPAETLPPDPAAVVANGEGWWAVRFRMPRTDGTTHWERDLLIAHRILAPVIAAQGDDIDLWRFHRRSADDGAGHQFSLIFYASAQTADEINRKVAADTLLEALLRAGVIDAVITDDVGRNDRPQVGDTSDASWSPVMQRTWPYYIMGVSRMWLAMIEALSGEVGTAGDVDLQDHYREVNRRLTYIWQHEGQHALLHHLNAVFGYEAMLLRETRWKSF